jgi:hypothetical protein
VESEIPSLRWASVYLVCRRSRSVVWRRESARRVRRVVVRVSR